LPTNRIIGSIVENINDWFWSHSDQ